MTPEGPYESGYPHGSDGYPPESDPAGLPPRHRHMSDDDVPPPPPPGMPGARAAVRMPDGLRAEPPAAGPSGAAGGGVPGQVYGRPAAPSTYGGPAQPSVDGPSYQSGGHSAQPGVYGGPSAQPGVYGGQSGQSPPPPPQSPQPGVYGAPAGGAYGGAPPPPAPAGGVYGSQAGVYGSSAQPGGSVSGPGPSASGGPAVYGSPRTGGPGPAYAAPDDVPPPRPAVSPMPPAEPEAPRVYGRPASPETEVAGPSVPQQRVGGPAWMDAPHPGGDAMGGTVVDAGPPRQSGVYGRPAAAAPVSYPEPGAPASPGAPAWPQQPPPPAGNAPVGQPVYGGAPPAFQAAPPPAPSGGGRGLRKFGYIGIAVLVVGAGVGALYYTSRPNPPSYTVGSCVKQAGDKAESAACGSVGSYQVVSRVADRKDCQDPTQPIIQLSTGDAATRVVCLKPAR